MLVVLDRSSSMGMNGKWQAAVQAIQQAIDLDAFDFSSLGLMMVPSDRGGGTTPTMTLWLSPGGW